MGSPGNPWSNVAWGVSAMLFEVIGPTVGWVPSPHSSLISSPRLSHSQDPGGLNALRKMDLEAAG